MESPFLRRGELSDELLLREKIDDLFAKVSCREGPRIRSLPFDLEGGIVDGLLGHSWFVQMVSTEKWLCSPPYVLRLRRAGLLGSSCSLTDKAKI